MSYEVLKKTFSTLTEEQQLIIYNLAISLEKMNEKRNSKNENLANFQTKPQ